ncbi:hypothetical protein IW261DRAFT_1594367 [Armillaria novae-zelandiae]|uniref:Uncharacterized protein n=1 Tax=Armillaria novae-zelandiae TaxID=153914 RepID=A0AA39P5H0_9AGAR|nr:hypothetical protein IW261DRAFT_1594367 [Armillaria novae-zelandiae]
MTLSASPVEEGLLKPPLALSVTVQGGEAPSTSLQRPSQAPTVRANSPGSVAEPFLLSPSEEPPPSLAPLIGNVNIEVSSLDIRVREYFSGPPRPQPQEHVPDINGTIWRWQRYRWERDVAALNVVHPCLIAPQSEMMMPESERGITSPRLPSSASGPSSGGTTRYGLDQNPLRLSFKHKNSRPLCFVKFEDVNHWVPATAGSKIPCLCFFIVSLNCQIPCSSSNLATAVWRYLAFAISNPEPFLQFFIC